MKVWLIIVYRSLGAGFQNGGFGGLFWVFIATVLCYSTIVASLAEMESMAPTSGGQYHWVSEFAPKKYQKFLSYAAGKSSFPGTQVSLLITCLGWMSTLGWLASVSSSVFVLTTLIQAIISVTNGDFSFPAWQYTLIMLAFLVVTVGFNTWGARTLPMMETVSLFGHIAGFVITIIPLWIMAPKNTASTVFTDVLNNGGWSNVGTSCLVSQISVMYCNLGSDSAVHICKYFPHPIIQTFTLNLPLSSRRS